MMKGMFHINHPNQLYEACLLGKHVGKSFPKNVEFRENDTKTWVYCFQQKFEAYVIFKNIKALVEKKSGYVIKTLRSTSQNNSMNFVKMMRFIAF
ncbi:hypothetical protein CR513_06161, partial [Mucuna pruriens]